MNLKFKKLENYDDYEVFEMLTKWDNDPELKHMLRPCMTEDELDIVSVRESMESAKANKTKHIYLLYDAEKLIGSYSIDTDFEHLYSSKSNKTGWIGLVIGDPNYRAKGIGKMMMLDIEKECLKLNCDYIELGVFDFNKRAADLYKKLGYERIGIIENFVFYDGKWFSDIRMLEKIA